MRIQPTLDLQTAVGSLPPRQPDLGSGLALLQQPVGRAGAGEANVGEAGQLSVVVRSQHHWLHWPGHWDQSYLEPTALAGNEKVLLNSSWYLLFVTKRLLVCDDSSSDLTTKVYSRGRNINNWELSLQTLVSVEMESYSMETLQSKSKYPSSSRLLQLQDLGISHQFSLTTLPC